MKDVEYLLQFSPNVEYSNNRFGTFIFAAARGKNSAVKILLAAGDP